MARVDWFVIPLEGFCLSKLRLKRRCRSEYGNSFSYTFAESYFKVILTDKNIGITFYLIMVVFEIITLFWVWMNMNIVVELRKRHFIGISIKALKGIWLLCVKDCYCFCFYFIVNDCYRKCCLKYHIRLLQ